LFDNLAALVHYRHMFNATRDDAMTRNTIEAITSVLLVFGIAIVWGAARLGFFG
jgi:hypothetical protein